LPDDPVKDFVQPADATVLTFDSSEFHLQSIYSPNSSHFPLTPLCHTIVRKERFYG
jgi:hypothetical protein